MLLWALSLPDRRCSKARWSEPRDAGQGTDRNIRPRIQAAYPGDPQPVPVQCKGFCCAPSILHPAVQQAQGCHSGIPSFPQRMMPDKSAWHAALPDSRENKSAFQVPMRPEESPGCPPRFPLLHTAVAPPPGKTQVIPSVAGRSGHPSGFLYRIQLSPHLQHPLPQFSFCIHHSHSMESCSFL